MGQTRGGLTVLKSRTATVCVKTNVFINSQLEKTVAEWSNAVLPGKRIFSVPLLCWLLYAIVKLQFAVLNMCMCKKKFTFDLSEDCVRTNRSSWLISFAQLKCIRPLQYPTKILRNMSNFADITLPVYGPDLLCTGASVGKVVTKLSYVYLLDRCVEGNFMHIFNISVYLYHI